MAPAANASSIAEAPPDQPDAIAQAEHAYAQLLAEQQALRAELAAVTAKLDDERFALARWQRECAESVADAMPPRPPSVPGLEFRQGSLERRLQALGERLVIATGQLRAARIHELQALRAAFIADFDDAVNMLRAAVVSAIAADHALQGYGVSSVLAPTVWRLGITNLDAHSRRRTDDLGRIFSVEAELAGGSIQKTQAALHRTHPRYFPER